MKQVFVILLTISTSVSFAQQQADLDSLKQEILSLKTEVRNLELDMATSEKKFKRGILIATIGYSVTIAGGLMLGRKYDDLGKVLLVTGGARYCGDGVAGGLFQVPGTASPAEYEAKLKGQIRLAFGITST